MKLKDFVTKEFGLIKGRDAIEIKKIESVSPEKIEISCLLSKLSCSIKPDRKEDFILVKLFFEGVILFDMKIERLRGILSEEEFDMYSNSDSESAIEEIEGSKIVAMNKGLHGYENLIHMVIFTYDFILEVVCSNFKLL